MALNENLRLPDLLAPIPGDSPVGPDLKYSNEFSEIEWAHSQGQDAVPPTTPPGFPGGDAEEHFGRVVELAADFLLNQSKDLRVASFLTSALLRVGKGEDDDPFPTLCFSGFGFGLELLRGLLEEYWDQLHSSIAARSAVLGILGSDALTIPVRLVPMTEWGHSHFHFKEWSKGSIPPKAPPEADALWPGNFEQGLADTGREFYERLSGALEGTAQALDDLDAICKEKFSGSGEPPPRLGDLRQALQQVRAAADQLLEKKAPPPPPPPAPEPEPPAEPAPQMAPPPLAPPAEAVRGEGVPAVPAREEAPAPPPPLPPVEPPPAPPAAPPPPPVHQVLTPQGPDQAPEVIASVARGLREDDPANPVPYLLVRALRWGEIRAGMDGIDPQLLDAPSPEIRKRLRGLFLEEKWQDLLAAAEDVMASEAGRGWLDIQRYSILAADKLGKDFRPVAAALRGALRSVLEDLPALAEATLMDDSAAASSDTLAWLRAAGFIEAEGGATSGSEEGNDTDPDAFRREASFERAQQMVQSGDPDGAIRLLLRRADGEPSERARFITRAEAAAIMVSRGEVTVARPILDDLYTEVDQHSLEDWEAGEVIARTLGLLYRCLEAGEAPMKQQVYQRICRLDPLLARTLGEAGHG